MINKNLLSGRDRELAELAEQYERAKAENRSIYMDAEDIADVADWYSIRQYPNQAMEIVEYGLKLHPGSTALLVEQAYLYLDDYDTVSAQNIVDGLSDRIPEVKILQAQIYIILGKEKEAKQLLGTLVRNGEAPSLELMTNVAYMYINARLPEEALKWLETGIGRYEDDEAFLGVLADSLYGVGRGDEAMERYNKLIDMNPYSAPYWYGLARCYFDKQMYDKTIEACDYAIVSDEEFADACIMKGHAYFYLHNDEKALECFREAARLGAVSDSFVDTFIGLGYIAEAAWEEAYQHLQNALDHYDYEEGDAIITLSMLYANTAFCLRKMGQKRKSNQYWKKSHEEDPEDVEAYLLEGKMYFQEKNYDKCEQCWERALHYSPTALTWYEIGIACLENGGLKQGRKAFENARQLDPDFYGINEKLATICLLQKDKESFMKYNELCQHPITLEDLQRVQKMLEDEKEENLLRAMNNILRTLQ